MPDFVVGGAVPVASVAYVKRDFEDECFQLLTAGNWVLLLGPRQHGKSSALVRLAVRLQNDGIATARVDFQAFSQEGATYEDVCRWFATQVARALGMGPREPSAAEREDIVAWLECAVPPGEGALAILIDEAGAVPTGALARFYAQLRALYNSRAAALSDAVASRVLLLFSGTFRPEQLINDENSPFNVSREVETDDLTREAAEELAVLGDGEELRVWAARTYELVGGQPYLLQLVLERVAQGADETEREHLFEGAMEKIRSGRDRHFTSLFEKVVADEALRLIVAEAAAREDGIAFNGGNADHTHLRVLGVCADRTGRLVMRNEIYREFALGNPQITLTADAQQAAQPLVHTSASAFDVIQDEQLREIARESYDAGVDAHNAGHNRLALAAFGCSLEASLLDYLTVLDPGVREAGRTSISNPPDNPNRPDRWSFEKMIEVAQATPKLAESNLELADAVRDWRNLIHPAVIKRSYRRDAELRPEARMAPPVIEALLRDLA